ncbi:MAG: beta-galactosidase [Planctomycetales bacterium]|nr:beta-galactosidase [Planctomycetales bacterium]
MTSRSVVTLAVYYGAIVLLPGVVVCSALQAEPLVVRVASPRPPSAAGFRMGTSERPDGESIGINSRCLTRNGKPWMPVMGEFHFTRCPDDEWRDELLRMKAGGIDIAATYVFWNHHEEVEGEWNWSGRRNLREFVRLCGEVGLLATVRIGPWCHGEVRNGGVPDWALEKGWKLRSNDAGYLDHVKVLYGQIARQLDGLLWKDGGPVIAIQLENEYRGRAEHLLALKQIARDAGLDVPLYTRTGWPDLATPLPFGEIAPLYGAYAEGFWDRQLRSMPGKYWAAFRFMHVRTDAAIAAEQLGRRALRDEEDAAGYPFLTCELGGGMMSSYHRRILMHPADVEAVALTKVGSGGNLPGYYMYHGGVNPEGRLSTLMEEQATTITNYNDMPVKNYDFQAPVGAFGQTRPHYHWLRRMHLMFQDFGEQLAPMPSFLPEATPQGGDAAATLRWAVRSDGAGGFVFVNNHQRGATLAPHAGVQFAVETAADRFTFPAKPVPVAVGARFIWPFRLSLGAGVRLDSATAQLVCQLGDDDSRTLFFAETPGAPATFRFANRAAQTVTSGRDVALRLVGGDREIRLVVLSQADSLALWKGRLAGCDRVVLSRADVIFDNGELELRAEDPELLDAWVYPPLKETLIRDGIFGKAPVVATSRIECEVPPRTTGEVIIEQIQEAGLPRKIPFGKQNVATAPNDRDFTAAAVWKLRLPDDFDPVATDALLRIRYRGDVARVKADEKLLMDDFYNGRPMEIGLRRFATELRKSDGLTLEILPFQADAPVFLSDGPKEGNLLSLESVSLAPRYRARVTQDDSMTNAINQ